MKRIAAFIKQHKAWVFGSALVILTLAFVLAVRIFSWDWTGFVTDTGEGVPTGNGRIILVQLPKRLWDWLGLLVIPTSLAVGALWFSNQQSQSEQRRATDREREDALRAYFDAMSALLLSKDHPLRKSHSRDDVRSVARGRTLSVLRAVNAARNAQVFQFLRDSHLIEEGQHIIDFTKGDLSGDDLRNVNLTGLRLPEVNLSRSDLTEAKLREASLIEANLNEAILTSAELSGANLTGATLIKANLRGANLINATLIDATLIRANLFNATLIQASLQGATLIDANLQGATLMDAILIKANLRGANLSNTNLSGADLTDAIITREQRAQATYYRAT